MPGSEMPAFGGVCKDTEPPLNRMLLTELYAGLEKQPTGLGTLPVYVPFVPGFRPFPGQQAACRKDMVREGQGAQCPSACPRVDWKGRQRGKK